MYFKILTKSLVHYGFQYKVGLNIDKLDGKGLFYANERSIMNYLEYGELIAEVEIPEGTQIESHKDGSLTCFSSERIIIKNIMPIWDLKTFRYLVEECNVNVYNYDNWIAYIANIEGHPEIEEYLLSCK